ncbi:MAG: hypothetical protein AB9922_01775 [Bacteroidales bacterium]
MKRALILIATFFIAFSAFSQDYNRALGLRIGSAVGVSYKMFLKPEQAVEGILDLDVLYKDRMKFKATGLYLFHFKANVDGLTAFAGPGISAGIYLGDSSGFMMSLDGMVGIEYKFQQSPTVISIDWNPKIQMIKNAGFRAENFGVTFRFIL